MPMKMGIHRKPIGHSHLPPRHSRVRGNDGGDVLSQKTPNRGVRKIANRVGKAEDLWKR